MPYITITNEVYNMIRAASLTGNPHDPDHPASQEPDGSWKIWVDPSTLDSIISVAFPGESISDTIIRAVAKYKNPRLN